MADVLNPNILFLALIGFVYSIPFTYHYPEEQVYVVPVPSQGGYPYSGYGGAPIVAPSSTGGFSSTGVNVITLGNNPPVSPTYKNNRIRVVPFLVGIPKLFPIPFPYPITSNPQSAIIINGSNTNGVLTATVCQGGRDQISCPQSQTLRIISAFYGRATNSICNPVTILVPPPDGTNPASYNNVNCAAQSAPSTITTLCQNQPTCTLIADPNSFGPDPCPSTIKYLTVQYVCQ